MANHLIVVDWGTSNFRAYLVDNENGQIMDEQASDRGLHSLASTEFGTYCSAMIEKWRKHDTPPVYLAGMVGAKRGWAESPQPCIPLTLEDLASRLIEAPGLSNGWILPGAKIVNAAHGGLVDVMRGEEIQALGVQSLVNETTYACCLPGTHSKWVRIHQGQLTRFITLMTGELYQAVLNHTLPGEPADKHAPFDKKAYQLGLKHATGEGGVLHALFEGRSRYLYAGLENTAIGSYLSGVLIGEEVKRMASSWREIRHLYLVGSDTLAHPYTLALNEQNIAVDTISAREATIAGVRALAQYHQEKLVNA